MNERTDRRMNERTRIDPLFEDPPCSLHEALAAAGPLLDLALQAPGASMAAAVVDRSGRALRAKAVAPGQPLVIGRHAQCDLRLDDPRVALRQVLIVPDAQGGGGVTRLWDLRTTLPMFTPAREPATAITATGSFAVTFGSWTVVGATRARSARDREAIPRLDELPVVRRACVDGLSKQSLAGATRVTRVKPLAYLGEPVAGDLTWGHLEVESELFEEAVRLPVTWSTLNEGILVGRYERCNLATAQLNSLSRVHAFIVRLDDQLRVFDLASTNGTEVDGQEVCCAAVSEHSVIACSDLRIRLVPTRRAVA